MKRTSPTLVPGAEDDARPERRGGVGGVRMVAGAAPMKAMTRARRVLVRGACLLSMTACGASEVPPSEEPSEFTPLFQTAHFDYYVGPGAATLCSSAEEWLERYYGAFSSYLGVALEPDARIQYRLGSAETLSKHGCDIGTSGGCANGKYEHNQDTDKEWVGKVREK